MLLQYLHAMKFFPAETGTTRLTPISTVLCTLCPMSWRNITESIQNWDNQVQQAKNFQINYNLSKLNSQNYRSLTKEFVTIIKRWWGTVRVFISWLVTKLGYFFSMSNHKIQTQSKFSVKSLSSVKCWECNS